MHTTLQCCFRSRPFLALILRRATVAAVIPTPFDRVGKQMVRDALEGRCSVETDAEVPASTRRIDLWVTPSKAAALPPDYLSRRKTLPSLPNQWVISSGRPDAGIDGLRFRPMPGRLRGLYESPPLHRTRLVVVSELPVTRDTLLVRLLGAGAC
jgi:hypothetical protein